MQGGWVVYDGGTVAERPLTIGVTMGDPAGIGPEVVVKALSRPEVRRLARFVIFGLNESLVYAADQAEIEPFWWRTSPGVGVLGGDVTCIDFDEFGQGFEQPVPTAGSGRASMAFCRAAIESARAGYLDGICTAPISKQAWTKAGFKYPGHTELFGHGFGTRRVGMAFVAGSLRVALASIHVGLFDLRHSFTIGSVFQPIDLLHECLRASFSIARPRIGVCGLNPHAGEGGQFGDEEGRIIEPAIVMAQHAGIDARGPFPADTLFYKAVRGEYDGVVAMYHDQGLIPVKLIAFETAVNLTLGLPIPRTSPDHGTAYDIAGQNRADSRSMEEALKLVVYLARMRRPAGSERGGG